MFFASGLLPVFVDRASGEACYITNLGDLDYLEIAQPPGAGDDQVA